MCPEPFEALCDMTPSEREGEPQTQRPIGSPGKMA
jgi:hypothetical protein